MRKIKFKVVRKVGVRRVSAFASGNYALDYSNKSIVRAMKGTIGVAVFGRKREAERFCKGRYFFEIVRVLPIGRGRNVKEVSRSQGMFMLDIFYGSEKINSSCYDLTPMAPPLGTIFYPAVEVLE